VLVVQDEVVTENPGPREGGPRRCRAFTVREKLDHLTAYESACTAGDGGGADSDGVAVRLIAGTLVALVDHRRAERSGLDQVALNVVGDRRQVGRDCSLSGTAVIPAQVVDQVRSTCGRIVQALKGLPRSCAGEG
jgi:hypothetical protein